MLLSETRTAVGKCLECQVQHFVLLSVSSACLLCCNDGKVFLGFAPSVCLEYSQAGKQQTLSSASYIAAQTHFYDSNSMERMKPNGRGSGGGRPDRRSVVSHIVMSLIFLSSPFFLSVTDENKMNKRINL